MRVDDLAAHLWSKRKDKELTDVVFVVGDKKIPAHRIVLATQSDYFNSLLYGDMKEASLAEIKLSEPTLTPAAVEKVLEYVYIGSLPLSEPLDDMLDIILAADYFNFDDLKSILGNNLANRTDISNVLQCYAFNQSNGMLLQQFGIHEKCLEIIEENAHQILWSREFLELPEQYLIEIISCDKFVAPEGDILQAVLIWKEHNNKSVEEMASVAKCVRLSRFTPKEIFTQVQSSGLFSEAQLLAGIKVLTMANLSELQPRGRDWDENNQVSGYEDIGYKKGCGGKKTIKLRKKHLNFLSFNIHPDMDKFKWYKYKVSVQSYSGYYHSQYVTKCLELFDYSGDEFVCRGRQVLLFPTIPLTSVTITIELIEGMEKERHELFPHWNQSRLKAKEVEKEIKSHRVLNLQFLKQRAPFRFLAKGIIGIIQDMYLLDRWKLFWGKSSFLLNTLFVISVLCIYVQTAGGPCVTLNGRFTWDLNYMAYSEANVFKYANFFYCLYFTKAPLSDYKVEFMQFPKERNCAQAFFNQPYSASTLIIEVSCDDCNGSLFTVDVEFKKREKYNEWMGTTQHMENTDIRSPIVVEFEERIVGYVAVHINSTDKKNLRVTINSIKCRSTAAADEIELTKWNPFFTEGC